MKKTTIIYYEAQDNLTKRQQQRNLIIIYTEYSVFLPWILTKENKANQEIKIKSESTTF